MGDFRSRLRLGSTELRLDPSLQAPPETIPPVPDVRLTRPSLLGPAEGSATLSGFAFGSAALTTAHEGQLDTLAGSLRGLLDQGPRGRVNAVGHTDRVGTEERNQRLGEERAESVRDGLVQRGIDIANIRIFSLGESVPAVETPRAEPRNRRVEVYFAPGGGPDFSGILTGGLTPPQPLGATPPPERPDLTPRVDYCAVFPEECGPDRRRRDPFAPVPPLPQRRLPPLTDLVWRPIDRALERGLRGLGIGDDWNQRLRDAARAGAERGATELLDRAMDAANLTGETREAVGTALRAAVQLEIPF